MGFRGVGFAVYGWRAWGSAGLTKQVLRMYFRDDIEFLSCGVVHYTSAPNSRTYKTLPLGSKE